MGKSKEKFMEIHEQEHIRDRILLEYIEEQELHLLWEEAETKQDESEFKNKSEFQDLPF